MCDFDLVAIKPRHLIVNKQIAIIKKVVLPQSVEKKQTVYRTNSK